MRVNFVSNTWLGRRDGYGRRRDGKSRSLVAALARDDSAGVVWPERCVAGEERKSKAPPFSRGGKRVGHPGLRVAQPERHAMLLESEDREWHHSRVQNENSGTRGGGVPPADSFAAMLGQNKQIFEIDAGPADKRRKIVEEHGEADRRIAEAREDRFGDRARTE